MFFPRLRRRAKWVFLVLAVVFGGGFVFFGVGAGGSGIGDYLGDLVNPQLADVPSAEEARERVEKNPADAQAHLDLARALQAEQEVDEAIVALQRYTELRPRDVAAKQQLAGLYAQKAQEAREDAIAAQLAAQEFTFAQTLAPPGGPLADLAQGPIANAVAGDANERATLAIQEMQQAFRQEAAVYRDLTLLRPDDPTAFLGLGQASQFAGDIDSAIAAYERFLELAPDDPSAPLVRQELRRLRAENASR